MVLRTQKGFTLIELMIVVAIIGILAAIAVPNFIAYRNKSRVAACVATAESMRGALAGFAADSSGNQFPGNAGAPDGARIDSWATLAQICNANGATLKTTDAAQGMSYQSYHGFINGTSTDCVFNGTGTECGDYEIALGCVGLPATTDGAQISISSSGITKQTLGA